MSSNKTFIPSNIINKSNKNKNFPEQTQKKYKNEINNQENILKNKSITYFCNNCGKLGHTFNKCNYPITSLGIIAFRYSEIELTSDDFQEAFESCQPEITLENLDE